MRKITIIQAANAIIAGGSEEIPLVEKAYKESGASSLKEFEEAVDIKVQELKANIEKARANAVFADKDVKADEKEFQPLRERRLRADENGTLRGFRPGQEYIVFLVSGETTVSESPPSKVGGDGPSRRKTVSIRSLYDPVEPKPKTFPARKPRAKAEAQSVAEETEAATVETDPEPKPVKKKTRRPSTKKAESQDKIVE